MQPATIVPFRQSNLLLVNHEGQPFVPMKPVVEGMGLAWQSQHAKLKSGRLNSTITEIVIVAEDGKQREMTCLPLRKLPGWLMSIHPNKVREELRDGIIAYQSECDDVLWAYWNDGKAVRNDDRTVETVLNSTIGTDGFHMLGAVLDGKVRHLPAKTRQRAKMHVWSQVHKAFSVVCAKDIPANQLEAARNFIGSYSLPMEGEFLPRKEEPEKRLDIDFTVEKWIADNPYGLDSAKFDPAGFVRIPLKALYGMECNSPTMALLRILDSAGYEVEACRIEVAALKDHVDVINRVMGEIQGDIESARKRAPLAPFRAKVIPLHRDV